MIINDTRNLKAGIKWLDMKQGEVYIDTFGNYVLKTDEGAVVLLDNGMVYDVTHYTVDDEFFPVKARLEID